MSKSACVVPFSTLDINPDGTALACCQAPILLTVDGRPASIDRDPLDVIWNAPELVDLRVAMARGEAPEACRVCWDHEKVGPASLRRLMNSAVHTQMGEGWSLDAFMRESARDGYRISSRPKWFQLQLGNTCNLTCRSCSPIWSSRIAADPIQRAWAAGDFYQGNLPPVIPRANAWYRDPAKVAELIGDGDEEIFLSLLGGEPFLIDEVWELLHLLVERGWSERIYLGLVSNGTHRRPELEQLLPAFRRVFVSISIDGYGPLFEYLRHGASWRELLRNLDWLQGLPNLHVLATPTLQNTNALGAVKLFRFFDERGLNAHFNMLTWPPRLATTNLPPRVRRIAAQRMRGYLDEEGRAENRPIVQSWAGLLEAAGDEFDPELFREYMTFTNDLDASRGQSLAAVEPELFTLLRASGVQWTEERRHTQDSDARSTSPGEREEVTPAVRSIHRDARVVAIYDPRGYEQATAADGNWTRLVASYPERPLPTDLGYGDPRVPEVREAQAQLAREHAIDAFCYIYPWSTDGSDWDAPLRELLDTGRPDFPFCLMWANEEGACISVADADRLLIDVLPYLRDRRYLRHEDRPLFVVRDVATLADPRMTAARWRAAAAQHGLGEIQLCAVEPIQADSLDDLGFDSALELPPTESTMSYAELAAASLARPRPPHPFFRGVLCQREPFDPRNVERYELWMRTAIEHAGASPVFLRAWNEWAAGAYLEPDDRDGRAYLDATRRAVRGPASGLVLLRRLRDSLGALDGDAAHFFAELEQVVSAHERSRDELTALVESAFATPRHGNGSGERWVPVATSHLAPSSGRVSIDRIGAVTGDELRVSDRSVILEGDTLHVKGWAHVPGIDPSVVDLFLVLTSVSEERVFRLHERNVRADVAIAFPDYPERCGFAGMVPIAELPAGTYRVGIVQRTPAAAYYDATPLSVRRN